MTPPEHTTDAIPRTDPGPHAALFSAAGLTADDDRYLTPAFVNLGVAVHDDEIRLILRLAQQLQCPLEIGLPPAAADALARALHGHALHADPTLARRGPL